MRDLLRRFMVLSLLVLTTLSGAGKFSSSSRTSASIMQDPLPRRPLGVYAKVNIEATKDKKEFANAPDIHAKFRELYARLLANPAVSGLTIGAHWDHIQISDAIYPIGYDFSYLDDAFAAATAAANATPNKSLQLIITPGFVSPKWLLNRLTSCDGLFHGIAVGPSCGKVAFEGFPEEQRDDGNNELPLPWNELYQVKWKDFLTHLNDRYKSNPAFVAIAVAGPVAGSDEMILPTSDNVKTGVIQPSGLCVDDTQPSGLCVDDTWARLIANAFPDGTYAPNSDGVFIASWKKAIYDYENVFSGVTLVLSPDNGKDLPEFGVTRRDVKPPDEVAQLFHAECSNTLSPLSCEAKTEVIQYFMDVAGPNGKATQVGGLTAASNDDSGNIGIGGVKLATLWPLPPPPPQLPALLGGAEFDHAVSGSRKQKVGCPTFPGAKCHPLSVEEAAYNLMAVFFNKTLAAPYFKGTVPGYQKGTVSDPPTPMHYLEVPYADVEYANKHQCISKESSTLSYMTLEELLRLASRSLSGIADGSVPADTTPPVTTAHRPTGLNGWYNERTIDFNATDDFSGVVRTELSVDNQATWIPLTCDGPQLSDGVHTILYRSIDLAQNVEPAKVTTVMIDATAPVTTASTRYVGRGPISLLVSFAASDNLSGVGSTEYSLDNGAHWKTGTNLDLNESGPYTILFRSTDVAGNVEKRNSIKLNVNLNPPTQPR